MTFEEAKNKVGSQRAELLQRLERADAPSAGAVSEHHASRERSRLASCSARYPMFPAAYTKSCDFCEFQEGRHYCLLHGMSVKNMDAVRCTQWQHDEKPNAEIRRAQGNGE